MREDLFRQINVWKEIDDNTVCCYRVFESLSVSKFFCKGKDYFHYPLDENQLRNIGYYAIDSLFQGGIGMNTKKFESIERAIEQFESDFE